MAMATSVGSSAPFAGNSQLPFSIALAEHLRADRRVEELLLELGLDQRALLLDDEHEVEPLAEAPQASRLERPGHGDLVEADAEPVGGDLIQPQLVERLASIEIALTGGDEADLRIRAAAHDDAVEAVGAGERQHRGALVVVEPLLLGESGVAAADVEAAGRHLEVRLVRELHLDAVDAAVDGRGALDVVLDALQADPDAGIAR